MRRFFRAVDKMIAQGKGKESQPKRAFFVPLHERTAKRSHSDEGFPRGRDNPEKGAEPNEEGARDRPDRRRIPRMFQKPADKKQGKGAAEDDPHQAPLKMTHTLPLWKPLTSL